MLPPNAAIIIQTSNFYHTLHNIIESQHELLNRNKSNAKWSQFYYILKNLNQFLLETEYFKLIDNVYISFILSEDNKVDYFFTFKVNEPLSEYLKQKAEARKIHFYKYFFRETSIYRYDIGDYLNTKSINTIYLSAINDIIYLSSNDKLIEKTITLVTENNKQSEYDKDVLETLKKLNETQSLSDQVNIYINHKEIFKHHSLENNPFLELFNLSNNNSWSKLELGEQDNSLILNGFSILFKDSVFDVVENGFINYKIPKDLSYYCTSISVTTIDTNNLYKYFLMKDKSKDDFENQEIKCTRNDEVINVYKKKNETKYLQKDSVNKQFGYLENNEFIFVTKDNSAIIKDSIFDFTESIELKDNTIKKNIYYFPENSMQSNKINFEENNKVSFFMNFIENFGTINHQINYSENRYLKPVSYKLRRDALNTIKEYFVWSNIFSKNTSNIIPFFYKKSGEVNFFVKNKNQFQIISENNSPLLREKIYFNDIKYIDKIEGVFFSDKPNFVFLSKKNKISRSQLKGKDLFILSENNKPIYVSKDSLNIYELKKNKYLRKIKTMPHTKGKILATKYISHVKNHIKIIILQENGVLSWYNEKAKYIDHIKLELQFDDLNKIVSIIPNPKDTNIVHILSNTNWVTLSLDKKDIIKSNIQLTTAPFNILGEEYISLNEQIIDILTKKSITISSPVKKNLHSLAHNHQVLVLENGDFVLFDPSNKDNPIIKLDLPSISEKSNSFEIYTNWKSNKLKMYFISNTNQIKLSGLKI